MKLACTEIDRDRTPLGDLVLERYEAPGGEVGYQILIGGAFLMATHGHHSESALGPVAHARLQRPARGLKVLVGGLGAGHTLRAALDLPGVTSVTVVEIGARVFDWNRRYFAEANGRAVDDPRVIARVADLADVLATSRGEFDLMLLDVDNGPGWLAAPDNDRLYRSGGVAACRRALTPGGVLAVWSPCRNAEFLGTLRGTFPAAEELSTRALAAVAGETSDVLYVAVRPAARGSDLGPRTSDL